MADRDPYGGINVGPGNGHSGTAVMDEVQDKAQQVTEQAREAATQAAEQGRSLIRGQVETRTSQAGEQISSTVGDVRTIAEQLRSQGNDKPAQLIDQLATRAEDLAGYLRRADTDTILRDLENFGRRQPWAVALGALAIGFVGARFLKASSSDRYHQSQSFQSQFGSTGSLTSGAGFTSTRSTDELRRELGASAASTGEPVSNFSASPVSEDR